MLWGRAAGGATYYYLFRYDGEATPTTTTGEPLLLVSD